MLSSRRIGPFGPSSVSARKNGSAMAMLPRSEVFTSWLGRASPRSPGSLLGGTRKRRTIFHDRPRKEREARSQGNTHPVFLVPVIG